MTLKLSKPPTRRWRGARPTAVALLALGLTCVWALAWAPAALAQEQTGNLYGTVTDTDGSALPGAQVELTGIGAPRTAVTDADGRFRFLNLDPGAYALVASLDGFATVRHTDVAIRVGRNTTLDVALPPPDPATTITEVIEITGESPVLDERKVARGVSISQVELEKIPSARDPWALVTQTPGVLSDRINVGGNESGQQSVFIAPGTSDDENSFSVDGVVITDMAAIGSSPTYYDFDQFEEIQVSTGGTDIEKISAGAALNLVTKRGSNNPRGSARYLLTDADEQFGIFEQAEPDVSGEAENGDGNGGRLGRPQTEITGTGIDEILDFGFEAGGPILRDRLWIWGTYGRNDIKQFNTAGNPDNTLLENSAVKLNGQPLSANSIVASWNRGDKLKDGRTAVSNRALDASWNQDGPTEIWKIEDTHVFSSDFYLTGLYSYVDGGFQLQSKGGTVPPPTTTTDAELAKEQGEAILDTDNVWHNGWRSGVSDRNTDNYQVDGSYFFSTGDLAHELKVGTSYRKFEVGSTFGWPGGRNNFNIACEAINVCGFFTGELGLVGDDVGQSVRAGAAPITQEYTAVWVQDTLTAGAWTVNAGLRYDLQEGRNEADVVQGSTLFPDLMPSLSYGGADAPFDWETFSPRVGATYALGGERKTLLRASFSRFAEQLQTADVARLNPLGYSYLSYVFDDADDDGYYDLGEAFEVLGFGGFDPDSPGLTITPSETDPNLDPPLTDEAVLGVEHALAPNFVVGLDATWRNTHDVLEARTFIIDAEGTKRVVNAATDFQPGFDTDGDGLGDTSQLCSNGSTRPHLPDGTPWCADFFAFAPGIGLAGGNFLTNGDREVEYLGAALTATKRLSNRWMARGYVSYGDAEWSVPASFLRFDDPTDESQGAGGAAVADTDGELFVTQSAASGPFTDVLIQSSWSANVNGMYQVMPDRPWGFNVAANLFAREGYPLPYEYTSPTIDGLTRTAALTDEVDAFRTDDIYVLDLRLEKDMAFTDNLSGIVSLDAFNVTNDNSVLQRDRSLHTATANYVNQTLSPRIYRLGFRLNWR
jgi:hypothetical protein